MPKDIASLEASCRQMLKPYLEKWLYENVPNFKPNQPFKCLNPAHQDEHPSMLYNGADKGKDAYTVHCYSCGWYGDIFNLFGALKGAQGFIAQAQCVCEWAGVDSSKLLPHVKRNLKRRRKGKKNASKPIKVFTPEDEYRANKDPLKAYAIHCAMQDAAANRAGVRAFLADRRIAQGDSAARLIERFNLGMYAPLATFKDGSAMPVKDTYQSLLIPFKQGYALISASDEVSYHGMLCPLFNARAIEEAAAEPAGKTKELFLVDTPADVLTLEAKGRHAVAVLNNVGAADLVLRLYEEGFPQITSASHGAIEAVLFLWFRNTNLEACAIKELMRCKKYVFKSFIDFVESRVQPGEHLETREQLKAGPFYYYLYVTEDK